MQLRLTNDEKSWRDAVVDLGRQLSWDDMRSLRTEMADMDVDRVARSFQRDMGARGWIGLSWPEPYGKGLSAAGRSAFQEELELQGLPTYGLVLSEAVARIILLEGSDELIQEHLPRAADGTWMYAAGLSEPDAGSDLFAMRTKAELDGDHYVVNGSKTWTSAAHVADWIATAVRTDPNSSGARGLSVLLISTKAAGVEIMPIRTMGGWRINSCFFSDVCVPVRQRIGEENAGIRVLSRWFENERASSFGGTEARLLLNRLLHRFSEHDAGLNDSDLVALGEFVADMAVDQMFLLRVAAMTDRGEDASGAGAMNKLHGSEVAQRLAEWASSTLGAEALSIDDGADQLACDVAAMYRYSPFLTIAGGTSEIQRNTIATRVLGLPKGA